MATSTKKKNKSEQSQRNFLPILLFMILELASKQRTINKKVEILKEYRTDACTAVLIWNFDDSVISLLPQGDVTYERNEVPVGTDHTSLRKEWKNMYHFVKGGNDSLSKTRRDHVHSNVGRSPS